MDKKKNLSIKILAILGLVFSLSLLQAGASTKEEVYRELVKQHPRPSVEEVIREFGGQLPPATVTHIQRTNLTTDILSHMPETIAKLELMYPGAMWASLGRDALGVADVLESFYLALGQPGRVVRVNASSGTFGSRDDGMYIQMLKDVGMDIDNSDRMRPFIIFDNTSYGSASQSTQLITKVYNYFKQKTGQPISHLFHKVAVVSTSSGETTSDPHIFFDLLRKSSEGKPIPSRILNISNMSFLLYSNYGNEWHGTFGHLVKYENGRVGGALGSEASLQTKEYILNQILEGYYAVNSLEFLELVRAAAKRLGYDFDEHIKTYSKDWVPPKFVPPEPYNSELVEIAAEKFFSPKLAIAVMPKSASYPTTASYPGTEPLTAHLKNIYQAEILNELKKATDQLQEYKDAHKLDEKQFTEYRKEKIEEGFQKLDLLIRQQAEELKLEMSLYDYLMIAYLKTFSKFEPYEKTYFSTNAKQIKDMYAMTLGLIQDSGVLVQTTVSYLRLIDWALSEGSISKKDYRRLVLHALADVEKEPSFYEALPQLFIDSPRLQRYLIKHAEVYLTSKKNKQAAQRTYMEMVNRKLLPKPNECELWLSGKTKEQIEEETLAKEYGQAI